VTFAFIPGFLALFSLPIIIGLHFLRARQKSYLASSLRLWQFLPVQVHGTRLRRLPLTWLLLVDLLVAALLTMALAQPQIDQTVVTPPTRQLIFVLDTSTSMLAQDASPSRFEQARQQIAALTAGLGPQDQAALLTFGRTVRLVADLRQGSRADFDARLIALQAGDTGHALAEALAAGKIAVDPSRQVEFHVFSDFQFSFTPPADFPYAITWHALGSPAANQAVLGLAATPLKAGQTQVFARLVNFSAQPVNRTAALLADGKLVSETPLALPANGALAQVWTVTGSPGSITVTLRGQDALPQDDSASTGLDTNTAAHVLLVSDTPDLLRKALSAIPDVDLQVSGASGYAPRPFIDLTVFDGVVPSAWPDGNVLVIDPQKALSAAGTVFAPAAAKSEVPAAAQPVLSPDEPFLAGIDFNGVRWGSAWNAPADPPAGSSVLLSAGGMPLLLRQAAPGRDLLVLLADVGSGNFSQHPAFPVLLATLVERARQAPLPASLSIGDELPSLAADRFQSAQVTPPSGSAYDYSAAVLAAPGLYRLELVDAMGQHSSLSLGVNAADLAESNLQPLPAALANINAASLPAAEHGDFAGATSQSNPQPLAPWLLGAALALLLVEATLAWR
jgi:hypothetical protein